jgi:hypothetical protein
MVALRRDSGMVALRRDSGMVALRRDSGPDAQRQLRSGRASAPLQAAGIALQRETNSIWSSAASKEACVSPTARAMNARAANAAASSSPARMPTTPTAMSG